MSQSTAAVLEYSLEELQSMKLQDLDSSLDINLWQHHWDTLQHHNYIDMVTYHRKKSGETIAVQLTMVYLTNPGMAYAYAGLYNPEAQMPLEEEVSDIPEEIIPDVPQSPPSVANNWRQWKV